MQDKYINIDMELLFKSLTYCNISEDRRLFWKRYNPTNNDIDKLFREYQSMEFVENFYDYEPDYDDEEFKMYMDYIAKHKTDDEITSVGFYNALVYAGDETKNKRGHFAEREHSEKEIKAAYEKIRKQQAEFESERIAFNNWQEPYFEGNWKATQKQVDDIAKKNLKKVLKTDVPLENRLWILEVPHKSLPKGMKSWNGKIKSDVIQIYYYGRDFQKVDYCWSLEKRQVKKSKNDKKENKHGK